MQICISIGIASVSVPLYLAECSPAAIRGAMVNSYVEVQAFGSFISSVVIYCVKDFVDQRVWCIPVSGKNCDRTKRIPDADGLRR
jgi:hypothetical protein